MEELALFEVPEGARVETAPQPKLTTGEALRVRQAQRLGRGLHPLSMPGWPLLPLHRDAAPGWDLDAPGLRCGHCRFRQLLTGEGNRPFPKCTKPNHRGEASRASHSTASDVRAWWPACRDFEPAAATPDG